MAYELRHSSEIDMTRRYRLWRKRGCGLYQYILFKIYHVLFNKSKKVRSTVIEQTLRSTAITAEMVICILLVCCLPTWSSREDEKVTGGTLHMEKSFARFQNDLTCQGGGLLEGKDFIRPKLCP